MKAFLACVLTPLCLLAEGADTLRYSNQKGEVTIDASTFGNLAEWNVGGREMVSKSSEPILVLKGETGEFPFRVTHSRVETLEAGWHVVLDGRFSQGDTVLLSGSVSYTIPGDFAQVEVELKFDPPSAERRFKVRELVWQMPLNLEPRKRVFFQGEHRFSWDTTYFYQFHADSANRLLRDPDRNEWRYVGLDQLSPNAFHLWKAESDDTARLLMQEGGKAAPFTQIYDTAQGVTVEVPQLAKAAPKRLLVDAAGHAIVRLDLWPLRKPLSTLSSEQFRNAVTASPHRIILHATEGESALLALREALTKRSDLPAAPKPEELLHESQWIKAAPQDQVQYVTGGYPFAKGELRPDTPVAVRIGDNLVASQTRPLGYWPDGSVKWLGITARLPEGKRKNAAAPPWVSFRDGTRLALEIVPGEPGMPEKPLTTRQDAGQVSVDTGPLHVELGTGRNWLRRLELSGVSMLASGGATAYANYQRDFKKLSSVSGDVAGGITDHANLLVDTIDLVESGPLRSIVRLEGVVTNQEPTRVILWLEFLAGRSEIRVTHTAEFLFQDPRRTVLTGLGLQLAIPLGDEVQCRIPGVNGILALEEAVTLDQPTPNFSEVRQTGKEGGRVVSSGGESPGWLEAQGSQVRLLAICRNFWQTAPKAISLRRNADGSGALQLGLWPEEGAAMDVRRYSNYPHRSQGEGVPDLIDGFAESYYANDPFVGISRSHEVLLGFYPADADARAETRAADFQSPPLLYAGWPRYEATQVTLPGYSPANAPRGIQALENFTTFWRYHQALHRWYGFWHFGDLRHFFQGGYGWTLPPEKLAAALQSNSHPAGDVVLKSGERVRSYIPANDWAYDNGRWGWSNTEGLPNLFLQNQYLRTGDRSIYFAAEALARHSRDVIVRHAGKWLGRGTRHGVQPWSDGNHEERQTTATEYKLHYFLSGEPRTPDVIRRLYDKQYSSKPVHIDAAHSGRLQGLLFHWELTSDPSEARQLRDYIHAMKAESGIYEEANLSFPGPVPQGPPKGLNKSSMFFHVFGGMHALLEYEMITGDPEVRSMLLGAADSIMAGSKADIERHPFGRFGYGLLGFAARHAKDPTPYRERIRKGFIAGGWKQAWQMVTSHPKHWTGPTGHFGSSVPGSFFLHNFSPYLFGALDEAELTTPDIEQAMAVVEEEGSPKEIFPISLQNEYDADPRLEPYLRKWQPWSQGSGR